MGFPVVRASTAPASGLSATSPASTAIGDLVLVFTWSLAGAGVPTHTLQSGNGYAEILSHAHDDGSTDGRLSVAWIIATAAGAQSYQGYTASGATASLTGLVVLQVGTFSPNVAATFKAGAATQTTNAVPNPPAVTPGFLYRLCLAVGAWHMTSAATVTVGAPTNWTMVTDVAGSFAGELAIAQRNRSALADDDPTGFTDDVAPNGTVGATILIAGTADATSAQNLPALTQDATAERPLNIASAASALPAITQDVVGDQAQFSCEMFSDFPALTQAATGSHDTAASGDIESTLPAITQTVAGERGPNVGTTASSLPAATQAATGERAPNVATAASTLPAATQAAAADVRVTGSAGSSLGALSQLLTAAEHAVGSAAQTLPALAQDVSGNVAVPPEATVESTLPALGTAAAVEVLYPLADVASALPALLQSGALVAVVNVTAASALPALGQAATAAAISGSATSTLPALATDAEAAVPAAGTAASLLPALVGAATAETLDRYPEWDADSGAEWPGDSGVTWPVSAGSEWIG